MTPPLHRDAAARWAGYSLAEQMANVGSEVERALRAHAAANPTRLAGALDRALELFDLTVADDRWRGRRRREILRTREQFCSVVVGHDAPDGTAAKLSRCLLAFAVLARQPVRPLVIVGES